MSKIRTYMDDIHDHLWRTLFDGMDPKDAGSKLGQPYYNTDGDCIQWTWKDEAVVADVVSPQVTLYRSMVDNAVIGIQILRAKAFLAALDIDVSKLGK